MRNGLILTLLFCLFFLSAPTTTWAVSLDFESGSGKQIISTPAFSTEVIFSRASNGVNLVAQLGAPGPPFSPSRSARWDPDQPLPDDAYRADFIISGISMISVVLGDNGGDSDDLFLKAFDKNGNVIGSDSKTLSAATFGGYILSVSASDISHVEFGRVIGQAGEGNSVQFDNFTYETGAVTNNPIPEPSTALLVGTGLLGLTIWRRRCIRTVKHTN